MTAKLTTAQRAARLPAPRPGLVVNVSLALWPAYKELHRLEAMDRGAVRDLELRTGLPKPGDVVYVERVAQTQEK